MHYTIKKRGNKWVLVCRELVGNKVVERTVKTGTAEWGQFGLNPTTSFEDAKIAWSRSKPLRAANWVNRIRERHAKARETLESVTSTYFPPQLVKEFEAEILPETGIRADRWLIVKNIFSSLDTPPQDWHWRPAKIYAIFQSHNYHPAYTARLLKILNKWGAFYCRKINAPFLPVEKPAGTVRQKLMRNHLDAIRSGIKGDKATQPLRLDKLHDLAKKMDPLQHRGLQVMFWFGLRKREAQQILELEPADKPGSWFIEDTDKRFPVLHVFQEKLREKGYKDAMCWKAIPAHLPEQQQVLDIIRKKDFKIPPGYNTREARTGFSIYMEDLGFDPVLIADWMGHVGKSTRDIHYRERKRARWTPPFKKAQ